MDILNTFTDKPKDSQIKETIKQGMTTALGTALGTALLLAMYGVLGSWDFKDAQEADVMRGRLYAADETGGRNEQDRRIRAGTTGVHAANR